MSENRDIKCYYAKWGHIGDDTSLPTSLCFISGRLLVEFRFCAYLTPWSRVLLEKLIVTELLNKFPAFYGSLRIITVVTSPPLLPILSHINAVNTFPPCVCKIHSNIILPHLHLSSRWSLPLGFRMKILCIFHVVHACYQVPCYAIFFRFPIFPPSWIQVFSCAPFPLTPSVCVIPLMSDTKLHVSTKQKAKL